MEKLEPGPWLVNLTQPLDTYLEYDFMDLETKERVDDLVNPGRYIWNRLGSYNHLF